MESSTLQVWCYTTPAGKIDLVIGKNVRSRHRGFAENRAGRPLYDLVARPGTDGITENHPCRFEACGGSWRRRGTVSGQPTRSKSPVHGARPRRAVVCFVRL